MISTFISGVIVGVILSAVWRFLDEDYGDPGGAG